MLYLIATPIGNLKDITFRAVEILKSCDYILCEDTRHSQVLLKHYNIEKPLKSFHQFNEKSREEEIIADLKAGQTLAVISDAGTPGVCDPGEALVRRCRQEGLPVTAVPGPCAWVTALSLSRMSKEKAQFIGFLDLKELPYLLSYSGTTVCYEAPHRILSTLEAITKLDPQRQVCVMRELTKTYEECLEGTASELAAHFKQTPPRGEVVLLIAGHTLNFKELSEVEHVKALQAQFHLSLADAIKAAAELRGVPKRVIYNLFHQ
jgi:16S rRNA (cytidine1402-2'-O)-methyltransferase